MKILKDKTAIITGATRGIGRGIAETFANQGANVLFTYTSSSEKAKEIENQLSKDGIIVKGFKSDASNFQQCQELVEKITDEFPTIDILINNAGITRDNLLMRMQEEDFDKVIEVNLKSPESSTIGIPPILFSFILFLASETTEFKGRVTGSIIIPLSARFTLLILSDCCLIDIFLWITPIPPS